MDVGILVAAYGLHYVQTIALSPLVGVFVSTTTHNRAQAQQSAFGFVWAMQAGTYLFFVLASETLLPFFYDTLPFDHWLVTLSPPIASFALLYIIREGSIVWLWHITTFRLNADSDDPTALLLQ